MSTTHASPKSNSGITYTPLTHVRELLSKITCGEARALIPQRKSSKRSSKSPETEGHNNHDSDDESKNHKSSTSEPTEAPARRQILVLPHTDTPMVAFKKLIEAGVQSAPVRDMNTEDHAIIGMLDLRDLVSVVVLAEEEAAATAAANAAVSKLPAVDGTVAPSDNANMPVPTGTPPASPLLTGRTTRSPLRPRTLAHPEPSKADESTAAAIAALVPQATSTLSYLGRVFTTFSATTRAVDHRPQDVSIRYLAVRNRCVVASANDPLLAIVDVIAGSWDVHRVLVVEPPSATNPKAPREVIDIFSPSDIVKLLAAKYSRFALPTQDDEGKSVEVDAACKELNQSVDALQVGAAPVLTVSADDTMLYALRLMNTFQISGLGVVDEEGRLIGNTSGSDLKLYLREPSADKLLMPVLDFVNEVRRASSMDRSPAVSVSPSSSFLTVLSKLAATKMHRVFVCDHMDRKPLAVIAVEDIVNLIHRGIPSKRVQREFKIPPQLKSAPASPNTTASTGAAGAGASQLALPANPGAASPASSSTTGRSLLRTLPADAVVKEEEGIAEDE